MTDRDITAELTERIRQADADRPLRIHGGDSKRFFGRQVEGDPLPLSAHRGIVSYDPAELVLTARAGTPLAEVETYLAANSQRLPFEPPHFSPHATLGGAVASGLSGPARVWAGSVTDHLLGVRMIGSRARPLRFGGEVMKNVAGYDVARLMAGSLGTLGVLTEVSVRVQPAAVGQCTIVIDRNQGEALETLGSSALARLPASATCWVDGRLYLRLEGAPATLNQLKERLGGQVVSEAKDLWLSVREQTHNFFVRRSPLWRLILPPTTPVLSLPSAPLIEWNGMQRWYADESPAELRQAAAKHGGFATLFKGTTPDDEVFAPLSAPLMRAHRALKQAFDPKGIFNPGRMYRDL